MQWLFVIRPTRAEMLETGPTDPEMAIIGRHFAYWQKLVADEVALVVGRAQTTGPDTMGLAIFRAETEAEARGIADSDPAVAEGVFRMELFPYAVALLGNPEPFRPQ